MVRYNQAVIDEYYLIIKKLENMLNHKLLTLDDKMFKSYDKTWMISDLKYSIVIYNFLIDQIYVKKKQIANFYELHENREFKKLDYLIIKYRKHIIDTSIYDMELSDNINRTDLYLDFEYKNIMLVNFCDKLIEIYKINKMRHPRCYHFKRNVSHYLKTNSFGLILICQKCANYLSPYINIGDETKLEISYNLHNFYYNDYKIDFFKNCIIKPMPFTIGSFYI